MSFFSGIDAGAKSQNIANYSPLSKGTVLNGEKTEIGAGDTISGKVIEVSGDKVSVALDGGGTITARVEGNIQMNQGQSVVFSARNGADGQLTLSPLFTNLNNSYMAQNALNNAGLPVNATTLAMTGAMMDAGMSISKENLLAMHRGVVANSDVPLQNIVELKQLNIPITPDNVEKYTAFKNYENQISEGLTQIADDLPAAFKNLISSGNEQGAANLMGDVLQVVNQNIESLSSDQSVFARNDLIKGASSGTLGEVNLENMPVPEKALIEENVFGKADEVTLAMNRLAGDTAQSIGVLNESVSTTENAEVKPAPEALSKVLQDLPDFGKDAPVTADKEGIVQQQEGKDNVSSLEHSYNNLLNSSSKILKDLSSEETMQLKNSLKSAGFSEGLLDSFDKGNIKPEDMLKEAETLLRKNGLTREMTDLLSSPTFGKVLSEAFKEGLLLRPENVDKASVEDLYQKLQKQTATILDTINASAPEATALKTDLSNMSGNMDFMNQMNQMFQYVQIPLKMNGSEATGDLYVYTNKKHLAENDGNVSALLHLDMNHLGPLDVYASITPGNQVFTKFYVADEGILDFLEGHLPELTERLEQRGFFVKTETTLQGTKGETKPELGKEPSLAETANAVPISKLSFDMRA